MLKTKYYLLLFIYLLIHFALQSQNQQQKIPLKDVLSEITKSDGIIFNYKSGLLNDITVFPLPDNQDLSAKIKNLEGQTKLVFNRVSDAIITISKPIKVCGYIIDSYSELPLEGATISGESSYAVTDENGYFEIESKSSEELLLIRFIGFKTIKRSVELFSLERCQTLPMVEQEELMNTVLLKSYLVKGIDKKQDWTTSIDFDQFTLLPGLIESDVLQTIQALPSVLSADETVSNINIRGGSNDQNLILWDDIKMYQTGHFFGLISSFNPHMTQTASVINNGTDVTYTDGISGTIHMQTEKTLNSEFEGIFGVNFLNAELFTDIPVSEKSSLQLSARKSLDDLVRTPTYNVYFDRVTQETEAQNNTTEVSNSDQEFDFNDVSLRWLYKPTEKDFLRLNFILIDNNLSFNETGIVDDIARTRNSNVTQNSIAFGLNYKRHWNEKFSTIFNVFNTDYKLQAVNADVLANQLFLQENVVSETNMRLENLYQKNLWQFNLGYNFIETEIINLNDIDLPRFVRRDEEVLRTHAVFAQAWYTNENNDFSIRGGIRS
ncbi:carboxypeptidase-like regulatory domain-containing protein [Winogradskyella sp. R77965]|uniref:carboxypeptidase-like regulatory domain-containing protein n=1 Tax=Winogradskyella sp. R77965 TaxID=3093872 RepID=UPI0037DD584E